jgi:hypothetical protein
MKLHRSGCLFSSNEAVQQARASPGPNALATMMSILRFLQRLFSAALVNPLWRAFAARALQVAA